MNRGKFNKKILIAPDSFKGSITAKEFCETTKMAIMEIAPDCKVDILPLADGGEGTVEAIIYNLGGELCECNVHNPVGEIRVARYGVFQNGNIAVMEMAEAAGLNSIPQEKRNPENTSSFGVGEMILDAVNRGCKEIIMGIGGSATNDGGMGMLSALGYQFFDKSGNRLAGCGKELNLVSSITEQMVIPDVKSILFRIACDVENPLVGKQGATYIYGPQKGGDIDSLERLESGMKNYAEKVELFTGKKERDTKGSGAAGGLGFAFLTFLNSRLEPGFHLINQVLEVENKIIKEKYDLIITGEGQMNRQTLFGKLPNGISLLGQKYKIPVIAIVGSIGEGYEEMYECGMSAVFSIISQPVTLDEAMEKGKVYLHQAVHNIIRLMMCINKE